MVVGAIVAVVAPQILGTALSVELSRRAVSSPKIDPSDILRQAVGIQTIVDQGHTPVLSIDPFTGGIVLSTANQAGVLFDILGTKFAREALAPTQAEIDAIGVAREEFIQSAPGLPATVPEVPTVREQVVAALTPTTAKVLAPGIVSKKSSRLGLTKRLGGPCAGANTGFSRLNCARGGFA